MHVINTWFFFSQCGIHFAISFFPPIPGPRNPPFASLRIDSFLMFCLLIETRVPLLGLCPSGKFGFAYWFGSSSFHSSKPKPFQPLICCPCDVFSNPLHSPLLNSVIAGRVHKIFCAIAAQWLSHPPHWYNELHQVICHYEFLKAFQEPTCFLSPMKIGQGKFIPLSKILNVKVEHPPNTMTSRDLDSIVKHLLRPIFY